MSVEVGEKSKRTLVRLIEFTHASNYVKKILLIIHKRAR